MFHSKAIAAMTTALHPAMLPPRRAVLMAIAVAVITSGCASGPDYRAPATPQTATGTFVTKPADTESAASLPADWWKLYDDPALDNLVQEALSANTNLRVTLANLDRARAIYKEARGGLFPSTNVSAGAGCGRDTGPAPKQWSYSGGLDVSYELDLFGRVRRDIEAARDDTDAVAAAHDAAKVVVVAETTRAYVDACTYGESIGVAHSSIDLAQRSLDLVSRQEHSGSASHLDVERAGVTLAQARAALPPLQGQRDAALFELAALVGRTPSQISAPTNLVQSTVAAAVGWIVFIGNQHLHV